MNKLEKRFINEFGNTIEVKISEIDIKGIKGVSIFISGPTSDTENQVTLGEAKAIHELLGLCIEQIENN